jgi:hypothetical protein
MKKYLLSGLALVAINMFLYEAAFQSLFWYRQVNRIWGYDFHWYSFFAWLGFWGVPLVVLVLCFILISKQKKSKNTLTLVAGYSVPMLIFYFGLIPLSHIQELWQWLEMANVFGAALIISILSAAGIFHLSHRIREKKQSRP